MSLDPGKIQSDQLITNFPVIRRPAPDIINDPRSNQPPRKVANHFPPCQFPLVSAPSAHITTENNNKKKEEIIISRVKKSVAPLKFERQRRSFSRREIARAPLKKCWSRACARGSPGGGGRAGPPSPLATPRARPRRAPPRRGYGPGCRPSARSILYAGGAAAASAASARAHRVAGSWRGPRGRGWSTRTRVRG